MLTNYIKSTLRNLVRYKSYAAINIFGLAIGLTAAILILMFVKQETSYDSFHENAEDIYRVHVVRETSRATTIESGTPLPVAKALHEDYPEIKAVARIFFSENDLLTYGDKRFYEDEMAFADSSVFRIFSLGVLHGKPGQMLNQPNQIVFTQTLARKYFGEDNPVGKTVKLSRNGHDVDLTVSGLVADVPANSHFDYSCLVSYTTLTHDLLGASLDQWGMYIGSYTYILMDKATDIAAFEEKSKPFMMSHVGERPGLNLTLSYFPITDIHLHSNFVDEIKPNVPVTTLVTLSLIAFFILIIASINFVNLAIALSVKRSREVGIRKVLGAFRWQLTKQYMGESIAIALISLVLALTLVELLTPYFEFLVGTKLISGLSDNLVLAACVLGGTLLVGLVTGLYPALVLSKYEPVEVLKSNAAGLRSGNVAGAVRKGLVVLQFSISIIFIVSTLIINQQLDFMRNSELGFKRDFIINIPFQDDLDERHETIRNELLASRFVSDVSVALRAPMSEMMWNTSLYPKGRDGGDRFGIEIISADHNYLDFYGLELIAGRNYSKTMATDERDAFIVNEACVRALGLTSPEEVLDKEYDIGINRIKGRVIGVVKDYHVSSMREEIRPTVMMHWPKLYNEFGAKISTSSISGAVKEIEGIWNKFVPAYPFTYTFLDQSIRDMYEAEERAMFVILTFSCMAILIACLGLFGLTAFAAEQRTKEMGIRRVLGASLSSIFVLFSGDFLKLILFAAVISCPIAYLALSQWLQEFAYRIDMTPGVYLAGGLIAIVIALVTTSFQAIKTAHTNPVESLRYE